MAKPKIRVRAKSTYRKDMAARATSKRMKAASATNKFNADSMKKIRERGHAMGTDVIRPDSGIGKDGRGSMYSEAAWKKLSDFNNNRMASKKADYNSGRNKGLAVGGALGAGGAIAGSYWSQKKREQKGQ